MIKRFMFAVLLTAISFGCALAQTPAPASTPHVPAPAPAPAPVMVAPPGAAWTLVKHVRFPIVQDAAVAAYPDFTTCQNEAFIYAAQFKQWWTTYACELRSAVSYGAGGFSILPHAHTFPPVVVAPPRVIVRPPVVVRPPVIVHPPVLHYPPHFGPHHGFGPHHFRGVLHHHHVEHHRHVHLHHHRH